MSTTDPWLVVGVDPAPTKTTIAFDGESFHAWAAYEVESQLQALIGERQQVLVLWDAPLCMDEDDFYRRQVDVAARKRIERWVPSIADAKAIGVAEAAGCPHNILSMSVLGRPVGETKLGLKLVQARSELGRAGRYLAEVHPAVAMGVWFEDGRATKPMPKYKGLLQASCGITKELLGLFADLDGPSTLSELKRRWALTRDDWNRNRADRDGKLRSFGDDQLDAWVAWLLGRLLLQGEADLWRGEGFVERSPRARGYYVMPSPA